MAGKSVNIRALMAEAKAKGKTHSATRITDKLARYDAVGQLSCAICKQVIGSEALWTTHIASKQHLQVSGK